MKTVSLCLLAAGALPLGVSADEPSSTAQPLRNIAQRHDQAGSAGKEIVQGAAQLPTGSVIGNHTHPGDEAGFVLKGTVVWKVRVQPAKTLKAGESFFKPRGSVHGLGTVPGSDGGTAASVWIVDQGQELATAVP